MGRGASRSGDDVTGASPRLLIVNADDYGLTRGISLGIIRGHREGIVTSTSVLAVGPAFGSAAAWLDDAPDLGIGAHLCAVGEDPPLLTAAEIPTLVDGRGRFARSWRTLVARLAAKRIDPADLRAEFSAQLSALSDLGRPISHVDTHQHIHMWPDVARVVVELAARSEIGAIRVPRSRRRTPVGIGVRRLARGLERRSAHADLAMTGTMAGLDEAGTLEAPAIAQVLGALAADLASSAEIVVHPGESDDPERERYRWGFAWSAELAALTSRSVADLVAQRGFTLATYDDLRSQTSQS